MEWSPSLHWIGPGLLEILDDGPTSGTELVAQLDIDTDYTLRLLRAMPYRSLVVDLLQPDVAGIGIGLLDNTSLCSLG